MFTGIITDLGKIAEVTKGEAAVRFKIETSYVTTTIEIGASIACNGCCLTVTETGPDWFAVEVSQETLDKTTLGTWKTAQRLNLERALKLGDELGGHLVSGHVDGVGTVTHIEDEEGSKRYTLAPPAELMKFIAPKGSVTLDGVSLTVNEVDADTFGVNIIPHTQTVTTFRELNKGDAVNVEIDLLARYVARLMPPGK